MRTAIRVGIAAALLMAVPAQAAVPLHTRSRADVQLIIDLPAMDRFGPIERIERIAENAWRVTSGRCHIDVVFLEPPGPYPGRGRGPPHLEPQARPMVCAR
jgi:hypothetical protein